MVSHQEIHPNKNTGKSKWIWLFAIVSLIVGVVWLQIPPSIAPIGYAYVDKIMVDDNVITPIDPDELFLVVAAQVPNIYLKLSDEKFKKLQESLKDFGDSVEELKKITPYDCVFAEVAKFRVITTNGSEVVPEFIAREDGKRKCYGKWVYPKKFNSGSSSVIKFSDHPGFLKWLKYYAAPRFLPDTTITVAALVKESAVETPTKLKVENKTYDIPENKLENFLNIEYWIHIDEGQKSQELRHFLENHDLLKDARHLSGGGTSDIGRFYPVSEANHFAKIIEEKGFGVIEITQGK